MDHRIFQVPKHALQFPQATSPKQKQSKVPFKEVLSQQQQLKMSKHASERIRERNIEIPEHIWQTIGKKVQEAKLKGVTDSLVVLQDATLLISAKNNTVVTALDRSEAASRIFTNINGTIVIND